MFTLYLCVHLVSHVCCAELAAFGTTGACFLFDVLPILPNVHMRFAPPHTHITGGKNGVIAPDQTTFDYVNQRTSEAYEPVYTDANASFCADYK